MVTDFVNVEVVDIHT